ncbi:Ger(x)C family spore germination protein [Paenibacillus sp. LHD-38]|uniref:Ger(x)C family spore germination protein n=1 Tax=Paenibacillus sp. LHD-38 TaxID=3072143 RepID=UPI00280D04F5|nr:Ger(x)C family spore germination protein [Paenibacillus sp. LHD-38]MDQ8733666.1 Ger(x)C family spore germination protein [Paenibacillus sp. LHD-38]
MMGYRSRSNFRPIAIILCLIALLFQTGCWSKDEIEDLSIIVGMGLDLANETQLEEKLENRGSKYRKKDNLTYTLQIVDKQSEAKSGDTKSDASAKPYLNVSETGDSLFEMIRQFSARLERPIVGHHMKVIIINESLSRRYDMNNLLSFMLRDNDIRLNCLVVMSRGIARDVLEAKGKAIIPAFRLFGMVDNRYRTYKILPPMSLIKLEGKMNSKSSYLLQNVIAVDGEVEFSGAAVIKGKTQKFRGRLSEEELLGVTWLKGEGKGGAVKSYDPKTKQVITYELKSMKSKIVPYVDGSKISFRVNIETEGRLIEEWLVMNEPIDEKFLSKAEQSVETEIKRLIKLGLNKIQKEYKTDVVGFGTKLSIKHPKVWKTVKEDWDEEFSRIPITYDVMVSITETGSKQGY